MPGDPFPKKPVTVEDYLALDRASVDAKHILWGGEVFAMAGASRQHNRIVTNLLVCLGAQLRGRPCEPFASDLRVFVPSKEGYVYPDVTVVCEPDAHAPDYADVLRNPRVVIEVLSDSTEAFDRGDKFDGYQSIPSMTDYVLVSSKRRHVDHYRRQEDGSWVLRSYGGDSIASLTSIECTLPLDEIYVRSELL